MSSPPGRGSSPVAAMVKGVVVLGVVVLVCTGLVRSCSFAPGEPTLDRSTIRRIDARQVLARAATTVPFPVRVPTMPPDWIAQSSDVPALAGSGSGDRAVRVGWVTPADGYARLVQTSGTEQAAVLGEMGDPAAGGTVGAGGRTWVVHRGLRDEPVWVTDVDGVRLLVTGSATPQELTALAAAALSAPVAPGRR